MRTPKASTALALTALIGAGALTGCTQQSIAESCVSQFPSGALSKNIQVLGTFGTEPTVSIADGFTFGPAQATTIERAEDRTNAITGPSIVSINYMIVEAGTNDVLASSASFANGVGNDVIAVSPGLDQSVFPGGLECAAPGDRVVLTLSAEEAAQIAGPQTDADTQTAFAILVDVHDVQPVKVEGNVQTLPAGFPGVITDATGQPGVVATPNDAPSSVRAAARIEGSGAVITDDSYVVGNMLQVTWNGWRSSGNTMVREPIMNTFATGPMELGTVQTAQHEIREALNGFTVGSQVVVIVPDEENDAMIYVVDILTGM